MYVNYISLNDIVKDRITSYAHDHNGSSKNTNILSHWHKQQQQLAAFKKLVEDTLNYQDSADLNYFLTQSENITQNLYIHEFYPKTKQLYKKLHEHYSVLNLLLQNNEDQKANNILSTQILPLFREIGTTRAIEMGAIHEGLSKDLDILDHEFSHHVVFESIFSLAMFIMLCMIIIYIHYSFAKPLSKIGREINNILSDKKVDHGSYEKYAKRSDEIGSLAKIAQKIQLYKEQNAQLNNELNQLNASLEKQVKHRTKHLEKAVREASEANQIKSEFLATISHEIRTPMNAILGVSEILQEGKLTKKQTLLINQVKDSCYELIDVVNDLFNYSKIETGQTEITNSPFNFESLFETLRREFTPLIDKKGLEFNVIIKNPELKIVNSDESHLKKIISSFLSNAIKFTETGEITLIGDLLENSRQLQITIGDTGVGIPIDKQNQIFDAFSQVETAANRRFGGTGLGLSIAKHLIEEMGGHIKLQSIVGEGSIFTITLPLEENKQAERKAEDDKKIEDDVTQQPKKVKKHKKRTVLLVEDNLANQLVAQTLIEGFGYNVLIASNGQKALDVVASNPYTVDVILMDCQMPVMDGYEATQHLVNQMNNHEIPYIPIIAQTANAVEGDKEKCLSIGMIDYIPKPLDKTLLEHIIAKYIIEKDNALSPQEKAKQIRANLAVFSEDLFDIEYLKELHLLLGSKFNDRILKTFDKLSNTLNTLLMNSDNKLHQRYINQAVLEGQSIGVKRLSENLSEQEEMIIANVLLSEINRIKPLLEK